MGQLVKRFGEWASRRRAALPGDHELVVAGLLVVLFIMIAGREITRPYYGLHGYAQAYEAWFARAHVDYGLGYTHGLGTLAVGDPPRANPARYLDHPPQQALLDALAMAIFGRNEWALRLTALIATALCIPFLLQLLKRLYDETTAVLAVLLFVLFPITGYFYCIAGEAHYTNLALCLLAWWSYLALIGALRDVAARPRHVWMLGAALFLIVQSDWIGACYAAAIGTHYVAMCLRRRELPDRRLFLVLLLSPAAGLAIDFTILLGAGGWDLHRFIGLYQFRSQVATRPERTALKWVARQIEFLIANFTLPVLFFVLADAVHFIAAFVAADPRQPARVAWWKSARRFRFAWLFVAPGVMYLAIFTEAYWVHQYLYMPLAIGMAVAGALAVLQLRDALLPVKRWLGDLALAGAVVVIAAFSVVGLNYYYASRHYPPEVLEMFKRLNREIPPDRALLAYFNQIYQESSYKPAFYRPEVAWYLNREIVAEQNLDAIDRLAASGQFSFYLADVPETPLTLVEALKKRYAFEFFKGNEYHPWPPVFAYSPDYYLFDLRHPLTGSASLPLSSPAGAGQAGSRATASSPMEDVDLAGLMRPGLDALYKEKDPIKAAGFFAQVLQRKPEHYGAVFQLAVALDAAGQRAAARPYWERALRMAETYQDTATMARIRERLAKHP